MANSTAYEDAILRVLIKSRTSMTTGGVADSAGISWNTADKYLRDMLSRGWVTLRHGKYWKANVDPEYFEE